MGSDPLERLRLALREAATDQFAGVLADDLGARLRESTDQLLTAGVGAQERELRHFRGGLDRFDERGRQDRSRVVAHGLRLCMTLTAVRTDASEAAQPRSRRRKQDLGRRLGKSGGATNDSAGPVEGQGRGAASDAVAAPPDESAAEKSGSKKAAEKSGSKKSGSKKAGSKKSGSKKSGSKKAGGKSSAKPTRGSPDPTTHANADPKRGAKKPTTSTPTATSLSPTHAVELAALQAAAQVRQASVEVLPGVGGRTREKLSARGLETIEDLAYLLPLGYEDRRHTTSLQDVEEGASVVVDGVIRSFRQGWFGGRYSATLRLEQTQKNGARLGLEAKWFHPVGGLGQRVTTGTPIILAGVVKHFRGKLSMVHPDVLDPALGLGIALRYPIVEGIGQRTLQKLCRAAIERLHAAELSEPLPAELVRAHALPSQIDALSMLHDPPEDLSEPALQALMRRDSPAHRRLAFEEFFFLQLGLLRQRGVYRSTPCALPPLAAGSFDRERLRACLPFEPTAAQWRVVAEIERDLARAKPMLRLVQGDVGSGKTAVAFAAALAVIDAGAQAALMAPTEILAEQHRTSLASWCELAGVRVGLLTGSTPRAQRASLLALLGAGEIDLLIGTHALLVDGVDFSRLALVIVDEQHRFGVEQRGALRGKGEAPHLMVMTATPIPRSLALTAFGELDVSVIDELPPGRVAPKTKVFAGPRSLGRARAALVDRVRAGDKAYVVVPLVEASEAINASDVEATAAAFRKLLPKHELAVVHGRMLGREKDAVMQRFRSGEVQVLVATTVIEVGVDVPDARAILVEHAERFGLAQLHQLRGRVGRSPGYSECLLHTANERGSDAGERLQVLEASTDGFVVAERDLELRGPGEVFGTRQSGVPRLRFASFSGEGMKMLVAAREAALAIIEDDPNLARHPVLRMELRLRTGDAQLWAGESG
ncbi:ATP-dependent DNA helicase RecG [Enhygromyxa salina]|nr:ATP-dependent DNA helicase RecG [Enhygromyxa salina]